MKKGFVWAMVVVLCLLSACSSPVTGESEWTCVKCGKQTSGNFCSECGTAKPESKEQETSKPANSENSTGQENSATETRLTVESYVYMKNDGSLWLTPKNTDKPIQIGKSFAEGISDARISLDGKYVYLSVGDEVFCADIDELTRGKEEWFQGNDTNSHNIDRWIATGNGGFIIKAGPSGSSLYYLKDTEVILISDQVENYYLDESKQYLIYIVTNESDEKTLMGVYLNRPESPKVLMERIKSVLDASDPEHILVKKDVYEFLSCYYIYDVGFDHEPVCAIEDVWQSWNRNGRIFAIVEGGRDENYSLPGYGDLIEWDNGFIIDVLLNLEAPGKFGYGGWPERGGIVLKVENDPSDYVLCNDGTVYKVTSESAKSLREMTDKLNLSGGSVYYTNHGVYVSFMDSYLFYIPVIEGVTTTEVIQVDEEARAYGIINKDGELYYYKNMIGAFVDLYKTDNNGNPKLLLEHVYSDVQSWSGTEDYLAIYHRSPREEDCTIGVYNIKEDFAMGDYDFGGGWNGYGGRVNEENYLYVTPDGELYLNQNGDDILLDHNVIGVRTPYT